MRVCITLLLVLVVACAPSESPPEAAPTDGSGPVIIGPGSRPGGGGTGGVGGAGGDGGDGGAAGAVGACVGDSDRELLEMSAGGRAVAAGCAVTSIPQCIPNDSAAYAGCIAGCVGRRIEGLSTGCALCFGAAQACALDNACTAACNLNTCSLACIECVNMSGCIDALNACTGLDGDDCAPPNPEP